jgi:hypothetical protein
MEKNNIPRPETGSAVFLILPYWQDVFKVLYCNWILIILICFYISLFTSVTFLIGCDPG